MSETEINNLSDAQRARLELKRMLEGQSLARSQGSVTRKEETAARIKEGTGKILDGAIEVTGVAVDIGGRVLAGIARDGMTIARRARARILKS